MYCLLERLGHSMVLWSYEGMRLCLDEEAGRPEMSRPCRYIVCIWTFDVLDRYQI